jgi:hypothetical protein
MGAVHRTPLVTQLMISASSRCPGVSPGRGKYTPETKFSITRYCLPPPEMLVLLATIEFIGRQIYEQHGDRGGSQRPSLSVRRQSKDCQGGSDVP